MALGLVACGWFTGLCNFCGIYQLCVLCICNKSLGFVIGSDDDDNWKELLDIMLMLTLGAPLLS